MFSLMVNRQLKHSAVFSQGHLNRRKYCMCWGLFEYIFAASEYLQQQDVCMEWKTSVLVFIVMKERCGALMCLNSFRSTMELYGTEGQDI